MESVWTKWAAIDPQTFDWETKMAKISFLYICSDKEPIISLSHVKPSYNIAVGGPNTIVSAVLQLGKVVICATSLHHSDI